MTILPDTPDRRPPVEIVRAYLELVRAPNIFTAMADVVTGFLFANPFLTSDQGLILALLAGASSCLYAAGVALNDVFDVDVDRQERPGRPIPSGQIPLAAARHLGWGLLGAGVLLTTAAAGLDGTPLTAALGLLLAGCIVFYDRILKRTPLGPLGMGACRMLNVLLGMSACLLAWGPGHWMAAGAIGIYIAGVTWLARNETGPASRWQLTLATLVILSGVAVLFVLPRWVESPVAAVILEPQRWYVLIAVLGGFTALRCFQTVAEPVPDVIQAAVKHCLLSLVFLDAAICYLVWDFPAALVVIFVFLIPAFLLGRWIYST
jgi:4-hydroxybenzoate polyprenyltransferase